MTLKDERYLPISELDLRAVVRDVKAVMEELTAQNDAIVLRGLSLSGINSAHPMIKDLFQEALDCPVKLLNPVLMPRVAGFSPDDLLVQASLARLMGLGLGFLPREQLLSCRVPEVCASSALEPLPTLAVEGIIDPQDQPSSSQMDPLDVEAILPLSDEGTIDSREESLPKVEPEDAEEVGVVEEPVVSGGEEEWPSLGLDLTVKDEPDEAEEVGVVEESVVSGGEEECRVWVWIWWRRTSQEEAEVGVVRVCGGGGEEEWPSLGLDLVEDSQGRRGRCC